MVHLPASVGCVIYKIVSWNLFLDSERDEEIISHKIKNQQRINC